MLQSLLLSCLFFGLISMILPSDRRFEWVYLLLIVVLLLSVLIGVSEGGFVFPEPEVFWEENSMLPESQALYSTVSSRVEDLTGYPPVSVESDLSKNEDTYTLTWVRVVLRAGNEKEVQDALRDAFSFEGFVVIREETG